MKSWNGRKNPKLGHWIMPSTKLAEARKRYEKAHIHSIMIHLFNDPNYSVIRICRFFIKHNFSLSILIFCAEIITIAIKKFMFCYFLNVLSLAVYHLKYGYYNTM